MPLAQSRIHLLIQDPMMHRFMNAVPAAILLSLTACNASSEKTAGTAAALPDVQLPELSLATVTEVTKELSQDSYEGRASTEERRVGKEWVGPGWSGVEPTH